MENAFAGEVVVLVIEIRGAEGVEKARGEWRGKKFSSEPEGEIDVGLGLPFAGAGLDY